MCPHFYTHYYQCLITFLMVMNLFETFTGYFLPPYFYFPLPLKYLSLKLEIIPYKRICTIFSGLIFVKLINLVTEQLTIKTYIVAFFGLLSQISF